MLKQAERRCLPRARGLRVLRRGSHQLTQNGSTSVAGDSSGGDESDSNVNISWLANCRRKRSHEGSHSLKRDPMIQIVDVKWESLDEAIETSDQSCQIRFWFEDWPVGQIRNHGAPGRALTPRSLAESAVDPDVLARAVAGVARNIDRGTQGDASIVICTRNRPEALARCLTSLAEQTLTPRQIIVVDNAPSDTKTRVVARNAGVEYHQEKRPGLDIARNTGIRAASSSIVAFTDDDVLLHPRWLERLVAAFDDDEVGGVTGLVLPSELRTEAQIIFEDHWGFGRGFARIDFGPQFYAADRLTGCPAWEIGAGASMAFRRKLFDVIGNFDERLDAGAAGCSGDSEFWHRLLAHDFICRYEPGAVAFHFHRRDLPDLSRQIYYYMRGHAAALLVQYERTGNWGNMHRLFRIMPSYYRRRLVNRLRSGVRDDNRFLYQEIGGFASGVLYYLRHRRTSHSQ
jgi:GT2 family glycosyltransferase